MSDDSDTPTTRVARARTNQGAALRDRDELSEAARADRATSTPTYAVEDITGQVAAIPVDISDLEREVQIEEYKQRLRAARATRRPDQRFEHLEDRVDGISEKVDGIVPALARVEGRLEEMPKQIENAVKTAHEAMRMNSERDHVVFSQRVDLDTAQKTGEIKTAVAEKLDTLDKRKARRTRLTKLIGLITSGGLIGELIHQLVSRL